MPTRDVREILVLETDRLCGAVLVQAAKRVFPAAKLHSESEPAVAAVLLADHPIDLFIVAVRGFDLDIITLLGVWAEHDTKRTRVLVVTPNASSHAIVALRGLPIAGIFDSSWSDLKDLEFAMSAVGGGKPYFSDTIGAFSRKNASIQPEFVDAGPVEGYIDDPKYCRLLQAAPSRFRAKPPQSRFG
jgi:DNA-binding NarL/FixJ family response regulator